MGLENTLLGSTEGPFELMVVNLRKLKIVVIQTFSAMQKQLKADNIAA